MVLGNEEYLFITQQNGILVYLLMTRVHTGKEERLIFFF